MKVFISGSSGLIGTALRTALVEAGCTVVRIPRDLECGFNWGGADVVVHLAGESIATGRWTQEKKERIEESRVGGTGRLCTSLLASQVRPKLFICASAIGYYGNRGDELLSEESPAGDGFLSDVCCRWEHATAPIKAAGIRTVHLRTGIVLSAQGGALHKMLLPFRMGAGGIIGSGKQYMSWISIVDVVGIIRFIMDHTQLVGPVNVVAPNPVTNFDFTKAMGRTLHRPTFLPMPAVAARLAFGEMADALLLSSTRVLPNRLLENGYPFKHERLETALQEILG